MQHVLMTDSFDRDDLVAVAKSVRTFPAARTLLTKRFGEAGRAAFEDLFFALLKAAPTLWPPEDLVAGALVVREVLVHALETPAVKALRRFTVGDRVQAALTTVALVAVGLVGRRGRARRKEDSVR